MKTVEKSSESGGFALIIVEALLFVAKANDGTYPSGGLATFVAKEKSRIACPSRPSKVAARSSKTIRPAYEFEYAFRDGSRICARHD